ncbi:MAG: glutamine amidotransferase [Novosphingobium sp.]|nr:glutamine amidotransferase [Novosphingobium sp.]
MGKTAVAVRHVAFEDLGSFAAPLAARGFDIQYLDAGIDDFVPALRAELVIILGGPISSNDEGRYPWLKAEISFIRERLALDLPLLGICLGAQLIARALGASVYPAQKLEIGVAPLTLTKAGEKSPLATLGVGPVLHWHGETFDLPDGAECLASTAICGNQAFRTSAQVLACQFHPEAGDGKFERWLIGHHSELDAKGIDVGALRATEFAERDAMRDRGEAFLRAWLDDIA